MDARIEIPEGWARWELEPIDPGGRRSADELMVGRGKLAAALMTKKVLERRPGSKLRTRLLTVALRGGFGLLNRGDFEGLLTSLYDAGCVLRYEQIFPDLGAGISRGHDGLRQYLASFEDAYSSIQFQPLTIVDPGGAMFAGVVDLTVVGRTTEISMNDRLGMIWIFSGGRVSEQMFFREWPNAIERLKEIAT